VKRVLTGMDTLEDFYFQKFSRIKVSTPTKSPNLAWSRGHVICLNDAGRCPTPTTDRFLDNCLLPQKCFREVYGRLRVITDA